MVIFLAQILPAGLAAAGCGGGRRRRRRPRARGWREQRGHGRAKPRLPAACPGGFCAPAAPRAPLRARGGEEDLEQVRVASSIALCKRRASAPLSAGCRAGAAAAHALPAVSSAACVASGAPAPRPPRPRAMRCGQLNDPCRSAALLHPLSALSVSDFSAFPVIDVHVSKFPTFARGQGRLAREAGTCRMSLKSPIEQRCELSEYGNRKS